MAASGRILSLLVVRGVARAKVHLNRIFQPVINRHRPSSAHGESAASLGRYLVLVGRLLRDLLLRLLPLARAALRR